MPFMETLNGVFDGVKSCLETHGFEVSRSDTQHSQQNILKDIVLSLANSDLVVADLTDLNPNVMYEVGLAHALDTPVIMITQNLEEQPFDLKSYRVIPYSPLIGNNYFDAFTKQLTEKLANIESLEFGSPVSDNLPDRATRKVRRSNPEPPEVNESDDRKEETQAEAPAGLFDNYEAVVEGFTDVSVSFTEMAGIGTRLNERIELASKMMESAQAASGTEKLTQAKVASRAVAEALKNFRADMRDATGPLRERWPAVDVAVTAVARWQMEHAEESESASLDEFIEAFESGTTSSEELLLTLASFRKNLRSIYGLDRGLNREIDTATLELDQLISLISEIATTCAHVERIIANRQSSPPTQLLNC